MLHLTVNTGDCAVRPCEATPLLRKWRFVFDCLLLCARLTCVCAGKAQVVEQEHPVPRTRGMMHVPGPCMRVCVCEIFAI